GKLLFVLKLNECQVVKGQRLERVSLTLMKRDLQGQAMEQPRQENQDDSMPNRQQHSQECFGV
ncbi:hypothetical protein, partial [Streptococcus pseudopneumoniae]